MSLPVDKDSNTPFVGASSDHTHVAGFKATKFHRFASSQVEFHGVPNLGCGVDITNRAAIMRHTKRNRALRSGVSWIAANASLAPDSFLDNLAQFELGFFRGNSSESEPPFDVVQQPILFLCFGNVNDIHKTGRIIDICANFVVYFDEPTHNNLHHFSACKGILQSVSQDQCERETLSELVRTRRGAGSPNSAQFGQHPVSWSI